MTYHEIVQKSILGVLNDGKPMTVADLAEVLSLAKQAVAAGLEGLGDKVVAGYAHGGSLGGYLAVGAAKWRLAEPQATAEPPDQGELEKNAVLYTLDLGPRTVHQIATSLTMTDDAVWKILCDMEGDQVRATHPKAFDIDHARVIEPQVWSRASDPTDPAIAAALVVELGKGERTMAQLTGALGITDDAVTRYLEAMTELVRFRHSSLRNHAGELLSETATWELEKSAMGTTLAPSERDAMVIDHPGPATKAELDALEPQTGGKLVEGDRPGPGNLTAMAPAILARLAEGEASIDELAELVGRSPERVADWLESLPSGAVDWVGTGWRLAGQEVDISGAELEAAVALDRITGLAGEIRGHLPERSDDLILAQTEKFRAAAKLLDTALGVFEVAAQQAGEG